MHMCKPAGHGLYLNEAGNVMLVSTIFEISPSAVDDVAHCCSCDRYNRPEAHD